MKPNKRILIVVLIGLTAFIQSYGADDATSMCEKVKNKAYLITKYYAPKIQESTMIQIENKYLKYQEAELALQNAQNHCMTSAQVSYSVGLDIDILYTKKEIERLQKKFKQKEAEEQQRNTIQQSQGFIPVAAKEITPSEMSCIQLVLIGEGDDQATTYEDYVEEAELTRDGYLAQYAKCKGTRYEV